jgi:hypothetical protein
MADATHPTDGILTRIAYQHLLIDSLKTRGRDKLDFHDLHVQSIRDALAAAFESGLKIGIARELGITHVIHVPDLDRFPWQVHVEGGHCHLFAEDFANHTRIRSVPTPDDDREHDFSLDTVPIELLDAVRAACRKDRRR